MPKKHAIAIYGTTRYKKKVSITVKKRVWIKGKHPVKQRHWKKIKTHVLKYVKGGQRITIWGKSEDVATAKQMIEKGLIPKHKYVDKVDAEKFIDHPEKYTREGEWIDFEEEESPKECPNCGAEMRWNKEKHYWKCPKCGVTER